MQEEENQEIDGQITYDGIPKGPENSEKPIEEIGLAKYYYQRIFGKRANEPGYKTRMQFHKERVSKLDPKDKNYRLQLIMYTLEYISIEFFIFAEKMFLIGQFGRFLGGIIGKFI